MTTSGYIDLEIDNNEQRDLENKENKDRENFIFCCILIFLGLLMMFEFFFTLYIHYKKCQ